MAQSVLVDRRNYAELKDQLIHRMQEAPLVGIDTETHNKNAHAGIIEFRKNNDMKAQDYRRITVTGLSIYPDLGAEEDNAIAFYFNLNHSDIENRLLWSEVQEILDAKRAEVSWIAHNAVYEITVLKAAYGYDLPNIICTLQMAVSAWGPDEYNHQEYMNANFGDMKDLFFDANTLFADYNRNEGRDKQTPAQGELLSKVLGKSSVAKFSYNGVIQELAYSYGLKKLVLKHFGHQMQSFEETLEDGDSDHMGELTGDQVKDYGAEDAYWAVRLFYKIYQYMQVNCPESIPAFFNQENPMVQVFANIRLEGMKVNVPAIESRRGIERHNFAVAIRKLKAEVRSLLPFPAQLNEKLVKYDKWYAGKGQEYRDRLTEWAMSPDDADDFKQVCQVSSPVSNAWAGKKCDGISIGHYYQTRLLMYDLTDSTPITSKGKTQSDAEARGAMRERFSMRINNAKKAAEPDPMLPRLESCNRMLGLMGEMASIEQRMKLYLTPYTLLTDPETGRMYPDVSSMLATRRMASSNPNVMQLAKRGESTYVRGFYVPDEDDHVFVSLDWSQIELVLIGEFSGDPEFAKAYGQLPYEDLHLGAAADVLGVVIDGVTAELLKNLHKLPESEIPSGLLIKPNGEKLTPDKAKKFWRTEVGKGSNFNYWYSGALSTVGEKLGWTSDQMWKATEAYRQRFAVAEAWRVGEIQEAKWTGYVKLPDGHRRTRWEVTNDWANVTNRMFESYANNNMLGVYKFGQEIMRAVQTRAGNQLVNAKIQGSSATLAKRSIISIIKEVKAQGLRATFKMPIHDELLFSVHRDDVVEFLHLARSIMTNHPEIVKNLKIYCTAAVGLTFEPFHKETVKFGQIELDELPDILGFEEGTIANDDQVEQIVDFLFEQRAAA